jgi:hypothetical protein
MAVSVFVSYSHNDVALVTPIVKLLRPIRRSYFDVTISVALSAGVWPTPIRFQRAGD